MLSVARSELNPRIVDWMGLHRDYLGAGEMEVIVALVSMVKAEVMIELGCRDGRTAAVILRNVASLRRYIGVDVPMTYSPVLAHQRSEMVEAPGRLAAHDPRFELLLRERGSMDLGLGDLPRANAVFIDGDHSERVVRYDSDLARVLIRPGGVVIWHDYHNAGVDVSRVLDDLWDQGWPIEAVRGTWLAFMTV